jgi:hypothetical protein
VYCRDCDGCQHVPEGTGLDRHICSYTGAEVVTLVLSEVSDSADNGAARECDSAVRICPRHLQPMIGSKFGQAMVRGILRQVQERGELDALLATYPAGTADRLRQVLLHGSTRCVTAFAG